MATTKKSPFNIVRRPLITEKTAIARSVSNSYVFEVHPDANKVEIKRAIEKIFGVEVEQVRTLTSWGKMKRGHRTTTNKHSWKKAYVSVKEGSSLPIVEGL